MPYFELPKYSETYTAGTVAGRFIDGLGFRYYWATQGLTTTDLDYKLTENGYSTLEIINHIYDLSTMIRNAVSKIPHVKQTLKKALTYEELRGQTLSNLKTASDIIKQAEDLEQFNIIFKSPKEERIVSFWNVINGPIEDAVWHCGQIASYRRASGNPINPNVKHLTGTVK
ncbi:hypothetical protein [Formosa sp. PL04]|uniref:hypothetical protein n=1 Tax=Formosa sp. PL04 TaxID=3081755 RepID=UPI002981C97E|nr:hypothetical protein [Formosa sp. PL04]MDW5290525.1 hypothetical protein [Formosa sp. PL04]